MTANSNAIARATGFSKETIDAFSRDTAGKALVAAEINSTIGEAANHQVERPDFDIAETCKHLGDAGDKMKELFKGREQGVTPERVAPPAAAPQAPDKLKELLKDGAEVRT